LYFTGAYFLKLPTSVEERPEDKRKILAPTSPNNEFGRNLNSSGTTKRMWR
jgi:hypothetical protein